MIYGATGYTGRLIAEEAVRRGHRPLLAARDASKLAPLAESLGLPFSVVRLDETEKLIGIVRGVEAVMHCAGPFTMTAEPIREACLQAGRHYLDITGEIGVFEASFAADGAARDREMVIVSGCGFDVIPTDCMAAYVADQVEQPTALELAISAGGGAGTSAGTMQSGLEILASHGGIARRDGRLVPIPLGRGSRRVSFPFGEREVTPIPWGDLSTAYRSTGIPNITTYMRLSGGMARLERWFGPVLKPLLSIKPVRRAAQAVIDRAVGGPSDVVRERGRTAVWARAANDRGESAEAWLESIEAYRMTQITAVRCIERVLDSQLRGALTPSRAFGADFVLEIPETRRLDSLKP
jgi:short subunit dehydrogenase-like uncharacterized protein